MFIPVRQIKLTNGTASSSAALALTKTGIPSDVEDLQAQIVCSVATVVKFGTSSVATSLTVTGSYYADGNFYVPAGVPIPYCVLSGNTHVAAQSADGATAGDTYITLGYNEKI
jgi:hypothetical protein